MSLDVYLVGAKKQSAGSGIFVRENGQTKEISRAEWDEKFPGREPIVVESTTDDWDDGFHANITHNLGKMAEAAGIYAVLWRPEENGIETARQLIVPLQQGLEQLKTDPARFKTFNPENGWGNYEILVEFVENYLQACEQAPDSIVRASR